MSSITLSFSQFKNDRKKKPVEDSNKKSAILDPHSGYYACFWFSKFKKV